MNIGFIGLGIMGAPLAQHLYAAGHALFVPDRPSLSPELRRIATVLGDPASIAEHAEALFLMLPGTREVEHVLFGPHGAAEGLSKGELIIEMSSISPRAAADFARRVIALGCAWLDAPVSGGEVGAKAASLSIMAGGARSAFERAMPLLQVLGKTVTHVGEAPGSGQTCKLANQIAVSLTLQGVAEALTFARRAGADPARVRQALMGGYAASRILELEGERMLTRQFEPGLRVRLHQADLDLALSAARSMNTALPGTALSQQLFSVVAAHGGDELDHAAIVTALERLAGEDR
jgi:2-hydroxy-3-oxopropionate reductase